MVSCPQLQIAPIIASLFLAVATHSQANIIVNGSFETPHINPPINFLDFGVGGEPVGFAWNVTTNNVDIVANNAFGTAAVAFDGVQYLDLVGFGSTGGIAQTFATVPGEQYTLSFAYANNAFNGFPSASAAVSLVSGLNTLLNQSITHSTSTPSDLNWTEFSATFIATGLSTTLAFSETVGGINAGVLLDAVSVNGATAVSEPASLVLIGLGFAGFGFVRRKAF